jgi:hypothetical protein
MMDSHPSPHPDPASLSCPAEFVAALRRLKNVTGHSYRQLERRAAAHADVLPRTTLMTALSRESLPREDLVAAFVRACGCDRDQVSRWVAARRRLAAEAIHSVRGPAGSALLPPIWYRLRRPARLLSAVTLAVMVVMAVAVAGALLPG